MTAADLQAAIQRSCAEGSIYWSFRDADGVDVHLEHPVEVRLDLPADQLDRPAPVGWSVARVDQEMNSVFLRRTQPLTDEALRSLFADAVTIAAARQGRFHSWAHGEDLQ